MATFCDKKKLQQEMLRKTFQALDVDYNFAISKNELLASVQDESVAIAMIRSMDANGDGVIDFKEFCDGFEKAQHLTSTIEEDTLTEDELQSIRSQHKNENDRKLLEIFNFCDVDSSGLISLQETCMAMKFFLGRSINIQEKLKIESFFSKVNHRQLSFEKFKEFIVPWLLSFGDLIKAPPKPLNRQIFSFVDADESGTVSGEEALMALKFLGKKITAHDKTAISLLPCFEGNREVNFADFEALVLPVLMNIDTENHKKEVKTHVEAGEQILSNDSLSPEEKIYRLQELHKTALQSDWLKKCGGYEQVDDSTTVLKSSFQ